MFWDSDECVMLLSDWKNWNFNSIFWWSFDFFMSGKNESKNALSGSSTSGGVWMYDGGFIIASSKASWNTVVVWTFFF